MISKDTLTDIGVYILEGMSEREACVLAGVSFSDLQDTKEVSDVARNFIEKKFTEFKHNHLKEIQKNKSEKNSQWLLEKLRPEEFGSKPRGEGGVQVNIIGAIIKEIQNDNEGIIKDNRGARIVKANEDAATGKLVVRDILA